MSDKTRVFIVDDSTVYRSQIRAALADQPDIEVVGFATDGKMACDTLRFKQVDVVTLDLEMPVMDGLTMLEELEKMGQRPYVIVFSSLSKSGAESTLKALRLGASDFLLKPQPEPGSNKNPADLIREVLVPKVRLFRERSERVKAALAVQAKPAEAAPTKTYPPLSWSAFNPEVVVIASSTGGPAALEKLFSKIRGPVKCPILIVQHMPPLFTATLAERLAAISGLPVKEGVHGTKLEKGHVYVAPGDFHMRVDMINGVPSVALDQGPQRNSVRPAADHLFESAAARYRNGVLGIVLTGMGADGRDGAIAIKTAGGGIFIQDRESSVVFGMPGSVFEEKAFDKMSNIEGIATLMAQLYVCAQEKAS